MVSESHQVNHRHAPSEHPRNRCFTPAFTPMLGPSGGAHFVDVELDIGMMRSVRRAKRDTPDLTALRRPTWSRSSHAPGGSPTRTSTRTTLPPSSWSWSAARRRHSSRAVMPLMPSTTSSFVAREGRDSRRTARRTRKRQTKPRGLAGGAVVTPQERKILS